MAVSFFWYFLFLKQSKGKYKVKQGLSTIKKGRDNAAD
jgi:hypothetical protein